MAEKKKYERLEIERIEFPEGADPFKQVPTSGFLCPLMNNSAPVRDNDTPQGEE